MRIENIIDTLKTDLGTIISNNYDSSISLSNSIQGLSEVDLDEILESNEFKTKNYAKISVIEENIQKGSLITGIKVKEENPLDILGDFNFGAIDGSIATVVKTNIALNVVRVGFGSYAVNNDLPQYDILDLNRQYVIADENVLSTSAHQLLNSTNHHDNIVRRVNTLEGYRKSIDGAASTFQSLMEINNIKTCSEKFKSRLMYLAIDGPLYRVPFIDQSLKGIKSLTDNNQSVFAITKRATDRSWYEYASSNYQGHLSWFDNDNAFLTAYLNPGERTPIFKHIRRQEKDLDPNYQRICCYLKLKNNKVIRIETIEKLRDEMEMIIDFTYALSNMNKGDLPIPIKRADNACKIKEPEKQRIKKQFEIILKKGNIPAYDSYEWGII